MNLPSFKVDQHDARTLKISYEKSLAAGRSEQLEVHNIQRFQEEAEREINDVISDLCVDVAGGMVASGQVKMTDDVERRDGVTYNNLFSRVARIVYCHERTIVFNHDLPQEAVKEAYSAACKWLHRVDNSKSA